MPGRRTVHGRAAIGQEPVRTAKHPPVALLAHQLQDAQRLVVALLHPVARRLGPMIQKRRGTHCFQVNPFRRADGKGQVRTGRPPRCTCRNPRPSRSAPSAAADDPLSTRPLADSRRTSGVSSNASVESSSLVPSLDLLQRQRSAAADAAAEDFQAANLAAELAVQPVAVHGLVEVADGQRADVASHGPDVVGRLAVQDERGLDPAGPAAG